MHGTADGVEKKKADLGAMHRPARCGRRGALLEQPAVKDEPRSSGQKLRFQKTLLWIGAVVERASQGSAHSRRWISHRLLDARGSPKLVLVRRQWPSGRAFRASQGSARPRRWISHPLLDQRGSPQLVLQMSLPQRSGEKGRGWDPAEECPPNASRGRNRTARVAVSFARMFAPYTLSLARSPPSGGVARC